MKNYLKQFGYAFVMFLAGLCPMGLGVVFVVIIGEKYSGFIMGLSMFVGALLCIFVMKKQFNISAKDVFKMPKPDELLLVIAMSVIYTVITALTEYRSVLSEPSDERYSLTDWIGSAFLAPVSEEIIFRFTTSDFCRTWQKNCFIHTGFGNLGSYPFQRNFATFYRYCCYGNYS